MYLPTITTVLIHREEKNNQTESISVDFCTRNAVILAMKTIQHASDTPLLFMHAVLMYEKDEFTLIGT